MQAKNGELGIVRFDCGEEKVCFVTGRDGSHTKFVYWEHKSNHTLMYADVLPKGRVIKVVPKPGKELVFLSGEFCKLTIDDVIPATKENVAALCQSVSMDTSKVKLGGCYHTGKAYCLGYNSGPGEEVELDDGIFTCLNTGVDGGAVEGLRKHRKDFNHSKDIPRFIVELSAVRIIEEDTDSTDYIEEICSVCCNLYKNCTCDDMCEECHGFDCACDEENDCLHCGLDADTCGCWDKDDLDDDGYCNDCGEICTDCECEDICNVDGCWCNDRDQDNIGICECGYHYEDCCCDTDDLDDENVDQTFRPMNAFARAQWLKSKKG